MPTKTKTALKSSPKASNYGRSKGQTQISISLSKAFLSKVDKAAEADNRNRSNWITVTLKEAVERELQ